MNSAATQEGEPSASTPAVPRGHRLARRAPVCGRRIVSYTTESHLKFRCLVLEVLNK